MFRSRSSKSQEAKMMHDLLQPTEMALRQLSSVAHLYTSLVSTSRRTCGAWIEAQKPGSTVKIAFPLLDFCLSTSLRPVAIVINDATGHARSSAKKYRTRKSERSVRSAFQNTVGRVSRSRDLFLFGLKRFFYSAKYSRLILL